MARQVVRPHILLGAAALGLGLCGAAVQPALEIYARHRLLAVEVAHPGLSVGALQVHPLAGELVAEKIVAGGLTIGRLRLPLALPSFGALWAASADAVAPTGTGTVEATDVALTSGTTTYRAKTIEIAGTDLTQASLAALLDPATSDSLESRLAKVAARAVAIPDVRIDDSTVGSERHGEIHQIALANVVAGKASAATASDIALAMTAGGEAANIAAGPIEMANVDLARLAHVVLSRRTDVKEPVEPIVDKLVVTKLKVSGAARDAGLAIGSITATGVAARPLAVPLNGAIVKPGSSTAATLALADLAQSVTVGGLDIDALASKSAQGSDDTMLSAAHLEMRGFGEGKIGGLRLRDLRLDGPTARIGVGRAEIGAFAVPSPGSDAPVAARPDTVDLGQITMEVAPRDRTGTSAAPLEMTVEHLALAQAGGSTAIPTSGSASVQNLGIDLASDGVVTHALTEMGYRHATLSGSLTSTYDPGAQELTIRKLTVTEPAMGSIDLTLRLADVSPDVLSSDPEAAQASAIAILAKSLDLEVTNAGLVQKALAYKARQDGIGVADERSSASDFFKNKLPILLGEGAGIKTIGDAVATFVADPRTLHISIRSKEGLGVGAITMLGDPGALLDTLDIAASANDEP